MRASHEPELVEAGDQSPVGIMKHHVPLEIAQSCLGRVSIWKANPSSALPAVQVFKLFQTAYLACPRTQPVGDQAPRVFAYAVERTGSHCCLQAATTLNAWAAMAANASGLGLLDLISLQEKQMTQQLLGSYPRELSSRSMLGLLALSPPLSMGTEQQGQWDGVLT